MIEKEENDGLGMRVNIHPLVLYLKDAVFHIAGAPNRYLKKDLYQAYSGHKVPLCVCQVSDCVCNVQLAVSDLDTMQEIKTNYTSKIGTI